MPARIATIVVALALVPALAAAQEFPPAEEGAKLFEGEPGRLWSFPIGVAVGKGWPAGHMRDTIKLADAFSSLTAAQVDAGIAYKAVGLSFVYRRGSASAGDYWCTAGQSCSASFDSVGGALMIQPSDFGKGPPAPVAFRLGIGYAQHTGEVKVGGAAAPKQVKGWSLFEMVAIGAKLGDATSRFNLGGYAMFHILEFQDSGALAGMPEDKNPNTPILFELGVRLGFD